MSQKLQLKSDLTLGNHDPNSSSVRNGQVSGYRSEFSCVKGCGRSPEQKDASEFSLEKKKKGRKRIHPKNKLKRKVADAVSITQSQNNVLRKIRNL